MPNTFQEIEEETKGRNEREASVAAFSLTGWENFVSSCESLSAMLKCLGVTPSTIRGLWSRKRYDPIYILKDYLTSL